MEGSFDRAPSFQRGPETLRGYDRDAVARVATEEVERDVQAELSGIVEPSPENRVNALLAVLARYGEVREGTQVPTDNSNRHRAEAAAELLAKAEKAYKEMMARMSTPANENAQQSVAA